MTVAVELGLAIPDDLSVVGFDNIPESVLAEPPLTTVDQSIQDQGYEAAVLLLRMLAEPDVEVPTQATLPTRLVVRRSCRVIDG